MDCLITEETTAMGFVIFGKGSNLKCIWADYMAHSDTLTFFILFFFDNRVCSWAWIELGLEIITRYSPYTCDLIRLEKLSTCR